MARKRRQFSKEYKAEVCELLKSSGKSVGQVAKELDLTETAVRKWWTQYQVDAGKGTVGALTSAEREELRRLRREVRDLQREREILKNHPVGRSHLWDEKLFVLQATRPGRSGRMLFGDDRDPVKKHGSGAAADLAVVTPSGDPV